MSVLIKGMDMPGSCIECPLFAGDGCKALRTIFHEITNVAVRVRDCPLVSVPTPHGRLIDRDAFEKDLALNVGNKRKNVSYPTVVSNTILKTPTIIEAEE